MSKEPHLDDLCGSNFGTGTTLFMLICCRPTQQLASFLGLQFFDWLQKRSASEQKLDGGKAWNKATEWHFIIQHTDMCAGFNTKQK